MWFQQNKAAKIIDGLENCGEKKHQYQSNRNALTKRYENIFAVKEFRKESESESEQENVAELARFTFTRIGRELYGLWRHSRASHRYGTFSYWQCDHPYEL